MFISLGRRQSQNFLHVQDTSWLLLLQSRWRGLWKSEALHSSASTMSTMEVRSGRLCEQCFLSPWKSLTELAGSRHNLEQPSNCCNLWLWLIYGQSRNGKLLLYMCCELFSFSNHRCHRSPKMLLSPDQVSITLRLNSTVQLLGFMSPKFAFNLYCSIFSPVFLSVTWEQSQKTNTWSSSIPHHGRCLPAYWIKWNPHLWEAPYFGST